MPRTQYRCGECDRLFESEEQLRGHIAGSMITNGGDHPHWSELAVSHGDLSAWEERVPG